eukprot:3113843-Rhodomonas_salina.1
MLFEWTTGDGDNVATTLTANPNAVGKRWKQQALEQQICRTRNAQTLSGDFLLQEDWGRHLLHKCKS